jgi:ribosomal silencing factor RsfS
VLDVGDIIHTEMFVLVNDERQVKTIAEEIELALGDGSGRGRGMSDATWVLWTGDSSSVFLAETRYYDLDRLWATPRSWEPTPSVRAGPGAALVEIRAHQHARSRAVFQLAHADVPLVAANRGSS